MAQPVTVQADVHRSTLTAAAARQQLSNPLEMNRRSEIQSLTITIPLLSDRNSYLVARLPDTIVRDLLTYVATLPVEQRRDYLSEWIVRNQQAVLEQYIQGERTQTAFRYNVVPVRIPSMTEAVPRRVEPPPVVTAVPRREEPSPHRLIEQRRIWPDGRDVVPDGYRMERRNELPQEVRARSNYFQPRHGAGLIPLGEARIEEFNGVTYMYLACYHSIPAPSHPSVSVYIKQSPLPQEVAGGTGTAQSPYLVSPLTNRGSGEATNRDIRVAMQFGTVVFRVSLTPGQLSAQNIEATRSELTTLLTASIIRSAESRVDPATPAFIREMAQAVSREVSAVQAVVPPPEVRERAPPQVTPREANREVQGGSGTRAQPFTVNLQRDRSNRNDLSGQEIEIPITFDAGGNVYFRFNVTLSQIANSKIDQTYSEIIRLARTTIGNMPGNEGGRVSLRQDLPGFRATVRRSLAGHADFLGYMDSH